MGKAALIAIAGFLVMGAIYSLNVNRSQAGANARVTGFQYETLAMNAAQVGYNRAEKALAEQALIEPFVPLAEDFHGEYESVTYDSKIMWNGAGTVATITSIATATDGEGNEIKYTMRSKYQKEVITGGAIEDIPEEAPNWFKKALGADGDITLGGNSDAEIFASGAAADELNANMHTNSNFYMHGNADVRGFVTAVGTAELSGNADVKPNHNPNDVDPVQVGVEPVDYPVFDAQAWLEKMGGADVTYNSKKYGANGDYHFDKGTRKDPYVVYVKGDLSFVGNVDVSGYVMFIVEGHVKLAGNSDLTGSSGWAGGDESNIAIYGGGGATLDLKGNSELYGQIYIDGDVELAGNGDLYGNIVTRGKLKVTGNADIYYREPSPSLTRVWENPPTRVEIRLTAHNEWQPQ